MNNFNFHNPTKIIFGKDRLDELNNLIPKYAKVMILYGRGSIKKFGIFDKVVSALHEREIVEFGGIEPNPKYETLMKAVEIVKKENIDFLLAVGGGSVIDGTKFVNLAANYDGEDPIDLFHDQSARETINKSLPIGTVLTLPATGSEMNSGAVISYNHGKFPIMSPLSFPKFSIIDPTLTFTLPSLQVANGIIDTFIHVVEQYVTYPTESRFQDRTSEGILQTLIEIGKKTINEPTNYDARANLCWCATMALNGLIGAGVAHDWATHMIGHELTALFGIDHGQTLAILQPAIWKIRKQKKREKLIQYAERVWNITDGEDDNKIDQAISKTEQFFKSLDVKIKLSDYNVQENQLDDVIDALKKHGLIKLSETRDLTPEIVRIILKEAF